MLIFLILICSVYFLYGAIFHFIQYLLLKYVGDLDFALWNLFIVFILLIFLYFKL